MTVKPIFAWYDLWIGAFWDAGKRRLYLFPVPMFGVVIQFAERVVACVAHPDRPSRTNLDGDELCQECADAWVRGEGLNIAWQDAQDAEAESAR